MAIELDHGVRHSPAVSVGQAWMALAKQGHVGLVHAHMTAAEAAAVFCMPRHRAPVVSTRHFPDPRGRSASRRVAGAVIRRGLAAEIAISRFVADGISERSAVIHNGVPNRPAARLEAPEVVMMQRLEAEKAPEIGIRAWAHSGLAARGWHLAIAGTGSLESGTPQDL